MRAAGTAPSICIPLLMFLCGCPDADPAITIPANCAAGEILVQGIGQWECGTPPKLVTPALADGCLTRDGTIDPNAILTSDGVNLHCESIDANVANHLDSATKAFDSAAAQVDLYDPKGGRKKAAYRGVTKAVSTGLMKAPGVANGLRAGAAICAAEYPGSHLCSMLELYRSISQGEVTKDTRIPKAWIYFPANNAAAAAQQPLEGLADSCAGYTYELDDRGWSGIAAEWTILATSYLGLKFYGGTSAACSSSLPLACCGGLR